MKITAFLTSSGRASSFLRVVFFAAATFCLIGVGAGQEESGQSTESQFISNIRQLTLEGLRAGEGYFNAEGTLLVFQSERRPDNPFFQIYLLDLQTGDIEAISPGHGKTTCSWIHPDNNLVLFSSTHDDPEARAKQRAEIEFRESGQTRRYAWDYDQTFEIYSFNRQQKTYTRLTEAVGYDAEGSYSPDGKLIAFASNRAGYAEDLPDEARRKFEVDASYLMDIYLMNADGSNLRRLTDVPGYDGGPFFSHDGKKICWRRFSEDGKSAEIFTMNVDGSDQQQLTRLGAVSWAPYFHPSGKYLIFTTNRHGFGNFELYLVAADGKSLPVRVTQTDGFDGLASFSSDGKKLTWTSGRTAKKDSQIFIADWNHEAALKALVNSGIAEPASRKNQDARPTRAATTTAETLAYPSDVDEEANRRAVENAKSNSPTIAAEDLARHVGYFAGLDAAKEMDAAERLKREMDYAASYFAALGLKPAGDGGTAFQSFSLANDFAVNSSSQFEEMFAGEEGAALTLRQDWYALLVNGSTSVPHASVAFAGFGIVAPAFRSELGYDSYEGLDVNGRWVVVLDGLPNGTSDDRKHYLQSFSSLEAKAFYAQQRGARGLVVIGNQGDERTSSKSNSINKNIEIPVIGVSNSVAESWFATQPQDIDEIRAKLDQGEPDSGFELDLRLMLELNVDLQSQTGRNVVARLTALDSAANEAVVIAVSSETGALALASALEIAEFLCNQQRDGKISLKRDVIFAIWGGSSKGQAGSSYFVQSRGKRNESSAQSTSQSPSGHQYILGVDAQGSYSINGKAASLEDLDRSLAYMGKNHPDFEIVFNVVGSTETANVESVRDLARKHGINKLAVKTPAENPGETVAAVIQLEALSDFDKHLILQGIGSSSSWSAAIESRNVVAGVPLSIFAEPNYPSDAISFQRAEVPFISAISESEILGSAGPSSDEGQRFAGAASISQLLGLVARGLASSDEKMEFIAPESKIRMRARSGATASLGTMPDYSADVIGVRISGVRAGTPAHKVGLQPDDVIIGLAGKDIESVQEYSDVLNTLKIGEETEIVIERNGERISLNITPVARQ